MDNQKKQKKIIILFIIIIAILSVLCFLFATGTISFKSNDGDINKQNQNIIDNNANDNTVDDNNDKNNNLQTSNITIEKIKDVFEFVYNYQEKPIVYCGENKSITDINDEIQGYNMSTEFSTYEEMIDNLKKYMSNEVISSKLFSPTNKNYYKEINGKLYCQETYKGYPYGNKDIKIEITSQTEDKITGIATMELIDLSENKIYDKVDIVLQKNEDNWIITSYKKQKKNWDRKILILFFKIYK